MIQLNYDVSNFISRAVYWRSFLQNRDQGDQKIRKKLPKKSLIKKGQNIHNKAQFESPKHLHQTTFETLKYPQQTMFETGYLGESVKNLLKQKVAKNVSIILG
jgi:hypothetical protein